MRTFAMVMLLAAVASAQDNPRYGKWKLKSEAQAPQSNIMTYEKFGDHGMKITVDSVNKDGEKSGWFYTTNFDGKDEPVTGNRGTDTTSVKVITDRINEIVNKKNGKINQILTNVLSPDGQTLGIIYMRVDPEGKTTNVTFATYQKIN